MVSSLIEPPILGVSLAEKINAYNVDGLVTSNYKAADIVSQENSRASSYNNSSGSSNESKNRRCLTRKSVGNIKNADADNLISNMSEDVAYLRKSLGTIKAKNR